MPQTSWGLKSSKIQMRCRAPVRPAREVCADE